MKAAIVERPGVLVVRDVPEPNPGEYEARCKLLYGATCSGTDQHLIHGRFPWTIRYPTILGHESIGQVVDVGPKVRHLKRGDLITRVGTPAPPGTGLSISWGGYAEYGIAKDHRAMREDGLPESAWKPHLAQQVLPPDTDPAAATMVITWRETLSYITRMGVGKGAHVLVLGSGGTGLSFVSHARNLGAACVIASGNKDRETTAKAAGASSLIDYRAEDLAAQIERACPERPDFVIDAVGRNGQVDRILPALKPGGTVGIYGIDEYNSLSIRPFRSRGTFTFFNGGYWEPETHDQVMAWFRSGRLDPRVWLDLDHPFPLERIHEAFDAIRERRMVKALVRLTG